MLALSEHFSASLARLLQQAPSLACAALFFLALSLAVNRSSRIVISKLAPSGLRVNILTYLFNSLFLAAPIGSLLLWLTATIAERDLQLVSTTWFENLAPALTVVLSVFVGDAIAYFRHRLEHTSALWPAHAFHHSDTEMTWFTLFRIHPINRVITAVIDICLLTILGFPLWAIAAQSLIRHYYGMLVHANVPWTYGLLGRVFVSPAMHRWHHVLEGRGVNSNFASIFSVFDQLFGTYYLPGPCKEPLGVKEVEHQSFLKQLLFPFNPLIQRVPVLGMRHGVASLDEDQRIHNGARQRSSFAAQRRGYSGSGVDTTPGG